MNVIPRCCFTAASEWPLKACLRAALGLLLVAVPGCEPPTRVSLPPAASLDTQAVDSAAPLPSADGEATQAGEATDPLDADAAEAEGVETAPSADGEPPSTNAEAAADDSTASAPEGDGSPDDDSVAAADSDDPPRRVFSSSRAPSRPGEAEKISFDDLVIGLQADVVYRPWMMKERPQELDGKKVRISGFMHGAIENPAKTKEFVLLRNLECKFGPGGQADHLAQVYMKPGVTTKYPGKDSIKVEGTLQIEPFTGSDGNTWSLYKIVDAEVVR